MAGSFKVQLTISFCFSLQPPLWPPSLQQVFGQGHAHPQVQPQQAGPRVRHLLRRPDRRTLHRRKLIGREIQKPEN